MASENVLGRFKTRFATHRAAAATLVALVGASSAHAADQFRISKKPTRVVTDEWFRYPREHVFCFVSILLGPKADGIEGELARVEIYPPCDGIDFLPPFPSGGEPEPCQRIVLADGRTITICEKGHEWMDARADEVFPVTDLAPAANLLRAEMEGAETEWSEWAQSLCERLAGPINKIEGWGTDGE